MSDVGDFHDAVMRGAPPQRLAVPGERVLDRPRLPRETSGVRRARVDLLNLDHVGSDDLAHLEPFHVRLVIAPTRVEYVANLERVRALAFLDVARLDLGAGAAAGDEIIDVQLARLLGAERVVKVRAL